MVCKEIEMGKLKCKRYWPESKDEIMNFAGLRISLVSLKYNVINENIKINMNSK